MRVHGDLKKTYSFLRKIAGPFYLAILRKYGEKGVNALESATPRKTGKTASSWSYRIEQTERGDAIVWENSNIVNYVNIALLIQNGHGTRNGAYVEGIDYINPALRPVFEELSRELWEEVRSS